MKRRLRVTRAAVDVQYSNGDYSNNLVGTDFALQGDATETVFSVDLSLNVSTRHRESNSFLDAEEFARKPALLESVHFSDAQVSAGVAADYENVQASDVATIPQDVRVTHCGQFTVKVVDTRSDP